ncbi:ATP-binding protein [Roseovarius sp. SK2]|uniref:ATP-binding protein n=1 Tax=Roseovarius TaxID=74030 RepID=UPI00237A1EEE|nr:ATP-binding protein [Roseovarius sp. SK2]MDD9725950.1 ATP-binding protein [Roseovarius sp. SK2]
MTTLSENLVNRVRKLTKPSNAAQAMQPFLEAVSNAMMAIDDRHEAFGNSLPGHVRIDIEGVGGEDVDIIVRDNGIGLETARYDAFCEIDTDFKSQRGGKGVGRLYWLDAFKSVEVKSRFRDGERYAQRAFRFRLKREEQIEDLSSNFEGFGANETGTIVRLSGLKQGPYASEFPKQAKK